MVAKKKAAKRSTVRKTARTPVTKEASKRIQKSESLPQARVVDKKALRIIRKIEKRITQFRDHVGQESKRDNIRYIHASELLTIVRLMRKEEMTGWIDA